MIASNHNAKILWLIGSQMGEYFARMSGAACYPGFRDEQIPIAILALLAEKFPSFFRADGLSHYVHPEFWSATESILSGIRLKIQTIQVANSDEFRALLLEFTEFASRRLAREQTLDWPEVLSLLAESQ